MSFIFCKENSFDDKKEIIPAVTLTERSDDRNLLVGEYSVMVTVTNPFTGYNPCFVGM